MPVVHLWPALPAALLGLAVGSFTNVLLTRVPRGQSVVFPPSHCAGCRRQLTSCELVPVLSFLVLRGRCRTCGAAIGWVHPLVEGLTAAAAVAAAQSGGWPLLIATLAGIPAAAYLAAAVQSRHDRGPGRRGVRPQRDEGGALLVELAVAGSLLVLTIAAMLDPLLAGHRDLQDAARRTVAGYLAMRKLEELRAQSYCDLSPGAGSEEPLAGVPDYRLRWDIRPDPDATRPDRLWLSVRVSRGAMVGGRDHELILATWRGRDQACGS